MKVAEKRIYTVVVREMGVVPYWTVLVVAKSLREARRIGVEALAAKGRISKPGISRTSVNDNGDDVWVEVI